MKKKILAISICVCICFALLAIPAFATSAPETTSAPNVFDTLLDGEVQELSSYTLTVSAEIGPADASAYRSFASWLYSIGATTSDSSVGNFKVFANGTQYSPRSLHSPDGESIYAIGYVVAYVMEGSASVSSPLGYGEALAIGSSVSLAPVYTAVPGDGLVEAFAGEVFTVGGGLISFIMSHWIVLIPVVAFLVILCIGAIRKIIKGV